MENIIQQIADNHGVILSKDDPILILHTFNQQLMEENKSHHEALLRRFHDELDTMTLSSNELLFKKAERIINMSLEASTTRINAMITDIGETFSLQIKNAINEELNVVEKASLKSERLALFNISASALTLLSVFTLGFIYFFR